MRMWRLGLAPWDAFSKECIDRQERKSLETMDVKFKAILIEIILLSIIILGFQSFIVVESSEDYSFIQERISIQRIVDNTKRLVDFKTRYIFTLQCNASATFLHDYFSNLRGMMYTSTTSRLQDGFQKILRL